MAIPISDMIFNSVVLKPTHLLRRKNKNFKKHSDTEKMADTTGEAPMETGKSEAKTKTKTNDDKKEQELVNVHRRRQRPHWAPQPLSPTTHRTPRRRP